MSQTISRDEFLKMIASTGMGLGMAGIPFSLSKGNDSFGQHSSADAIKGFHIDLRVEVMTIPALKAFVDELSQFGINALIMEYEATYPFEKHATIANEYAYSREEITDFISYCSSQGIEVIPLQECLGHAQYILRHERYSSLKIEHSILSQIDPLDENAIPLFRELIEDLIATHPSEYIHVGGDEARHLNHPKYDDFNEKHGVSKLYTRYMKQICQIAIENGKTPLLWADMILKHPEAVEDLPIDDIIFIDWNYGWDIDRFGDISDLQQKGCTFWGAPALRSAPDNYYVTHWEKHFNNIRDFIPYSREAGYTGMVMTSWSTSGQYSFWWEGSRRDLLEMFPIRNVYPLSGFRILVAAYAKALQMDEPLNPKQFVIDYCRQRFGLSESDTSALWNYFAHRQMLIHNGKATDGQKVEGMLQDFKPLHAALQQLEPQQHEQEFEHFKLSADIREFYLSVKVVEAIVESDNFDRSKIPMVKEKLEPLVEQSKQLNERFAALNEGFLYDKELERLNHLRNKRLNTLWNTYGTSR